MDFTDSTKVVFNRIQKLEPENVSKIVGYLLLQDHGEREMIRLAFSPDNVLLSLIDKAKTGLLSNSVASLSASPPQMSPVPISEVPLQFTPFPPSQSFSSLSSAIRVLNPYWDPQISAEQMALRNLEYVPVGYSESPPDDYRFQNQLQFFSLEDQMDVGNSNQSDASGSYYLPKAAVGPRASRRSPSMPEFPVKVCHYFSKGFCKHGSNCRYFHSHLIPESFGQMFNPSTNEITNEDQDFSLRSLEKLEMEITELLKSRRGFPVSIASLPMLYYEKYGKTLQAEGYLTESQRHGKAGYSLTKLLARLKNSIRLIDSYRPHGQHCVILAKDFPKYMESNGERNEHGGILAGSRQIYLTFPAESTFSEQDVSNYFNKYGPVQDVRIPCQQRRMFGFVTFVYSESVKQILAKGNPHFVCGARVLVKPYREKSRLSERKCTENFYHSMHYGSHILDAESDIHSSHKFNDNSRILRKQAMEENECLLEFERMRFSEMQLAAKSVNPHSYFGHVNEMKLSEAHEDQSDLPSTEGFNYLLDVLNNGSGTSEETIRCIETKYNDHESNQGLNLPDSPFASPVAGGISTVS
ncbi:zinc finger CCCH domain-containing protein 18 isoform X2 [Daucus carota subsp. sativus]|uniref:zinc finger CCCH domain-containing protein 18 isoform X2 n=1 Tax=Daucus carota subsp. sativus TaxID=79200 RepID=UPI0007B273FD|nr:PREDICTED: zinc finger CCCH domain-containing protein 18-like isoform X2 [Daucus carota subsp. sativus]